MDFVSYCLHNISFSNNILANLYKTFCRTSYFLLQDNAVFLRDMITHAKSHRSENAHAFVRGRGQGENCSAALAVKSARTEGEYV